MELPIYNLEISDNINDDVEVDFVALVDRPAIEKNFMTFSKHSTFAIQDEEQRIASGPLMLSDTPIYRNDGGKEYYVVFPKETIRKIVLKFFKKGYQSNVNLMHDSSQVVDGVTMFESWITDANRGIKPMEGFDDAPDGSWFGSFKVENDDVWNKIKSGEFKGFSVEGFFNYKKNQMSKDEQLWSEIVSILKQVK